MDRFDLEKFVRAQDQVLPQVRAELAGGRKRSHWMWFVFPQLTGLGHSPMAQRYAIASLAEAEAYLAHEALGPRLVECVDLVNRVDGRTANQILGSPDDMKFRSCVTLFAMVQGASPVFRAALDKYFGGVPDDATTKILHP